MKIVLVSFSQDINVMNPEESANYLVVGDEESGLSTHIPVPIETVQAIAAFVEEVRTADPTTPPFPDPAPEEGPEPEQEEELRDLHFEAPPPAPPAPGRKRLVLGPTPNLEVHGSRPSAIRQASAQVRNLPSSEDEVPSV